ncbi:MAG: alpha/beta hydrolase [Cyanobacteria bacterium P01_A01_bin.114]
MGWGHQYIHTNQVKLHCITQGEGELVILLHGLLEFWYSWRHQLPVLSKQFKVVVPDLRGYNDSDKPAVGYDLKTLGQDIQGLISALGYSKAHVVGHDWGGTIALHFARQYPQSLDKLAVLSVPQSLLDLVSNNFAQLQRSWYLLALQLPGFPTWLQEQNLRDFLADLFQGQAIRKSAFTRSETAIFQAALQKPGAFSAVTRHAQQFFTSRAWRPALLGQPISHPALVLWGEEDPLLSTRYLREIGNLLQQGYQAKSIPFCGHWIQQEAPQTVSRELMKFLGSSA